MHNSNLMGWNWHWRTEPILDGWEWQVIKLYSGGEEHVTMRGTTATKTAADMIAKDYCDKLIRGEMTA